MFDRSGEFQRLATDVNKSGFSILSGIKSDQRPRERIGTDGQIIPPGLPKDVEAAIAKPEESFEQHLILKTAPLEEFVSEQDSIQGGFERVEKLMAETDQLHRSLLVTVDFGEAEQLRRRIDATSTLISTESAQIRRLLKAMDEETRGQGSALSPSDLRLRQSKHRALCKRFMLLVERFERMQQKHREKYQKQLERQYMLMKPDASESELAQLRESPHQQIFMLESRSRASQALQGMKDRHEEMQKLEKSMKELHEMFLDISFLVDQQGYTIDRVEEYVDASREATEQAAVVMREVVVKQKRAQRRRWFFAGLGSIILIILVVIIVLALTNNL